MKYNISYKDVIGENTKFWRAAGLDHLFFLTDDPTGQSLLDRMGNKGKGTLKYVRNHHTFTNHTILGHQVGARVYSEDENGNPVYNFEHINRYFGEYVKRGIKPIVEYDYMPFELAEKENIQDKDEGFLTNDSGPKDWKKWEDLIRKFTENLIETFGIDEVRTWYFEVWNEPDYWPLDDVETFYKMYDVFSETVKSVDKELRVGGPGCYRADFMVGFLNHITYGTNYVTGKVGSTIDFISFHVYAMSYLWIKECPLIVPTVQQILHDIIWVRRLIITKFPSLAEKEFQVNEWGVCSGYEYTREVCPNFALRDTEFSALFFVKLMCSLWTLGDAYDLCPDMMLYWGFSFEDFNNILFNSERSLTTAGGLAKPILTAMEIFEKTGDERLKVDGQYNGGTSGIAATKGDDSIQIALYHFDEQEPHSEIKKTFDIDVEGLDCKSVKFEVFTMDSENNVHAEWVRQGRPETPDLADMDKLREKTELKPEVLTAEVKDGKINLNFTLPSSTFVFLDGKLQ